MNFNSFLPQPFHGFHLREVDGHFLINDLNIEKGIEVMKNYGLRKLELNPNYFKKRDISFLSQYDFIESLAILIKVDAGFDSI